MENIISDVHTDWRDVLANIYMKHKTHIDVIVEKYEENSRFYK